jgi:hypothetical protein
MTIPQSTHLNQEGVTIIDRSHPMSRCRPRNTDQETNVRNRIDGSCHSA